MRKLFFFLFVVVVSLYSCQLFFSSPVGANYHNESDAGRFSTGYYLSELSSDTDYWVSVKYGIPHYYYIIIEESDIEIYVLSAMFEIIYAVKGAYSTDYLEYYSYEGDIEYNKIYDEALGKFIDSNNLTSTMRISSYQGWDSEELDSVNFNFGNFNNSYLSLYLDKIKNPLEISVKSSIEHGIIYTADTDSDDFNEVYMIDNSGGNKSIVFDSKDIYYNISKPQLSPDGTKLVFNYYKDSIWQLGVVNVGEPYLINLYYNLGENVTDSVWDSDGVHIYFTTSNIGADDGSGEVRRVNLDTKELTNLTNDNRTDRWVHFSNGKIAFIHFQSINVSYSRDVYVMNSDGSNQLNLMNESANGELTSDDNPKLNSDASVVAFQSFRSGNYPLGDIYTVPAKGGSFTRITTNSADRYIGGWSYDDLTLLLSKKKVNGDYAIYELGLDGIETLIHEESFGISTNISQTF